MKRKKHMKKLNIALWYQTVVPVEEEAQFFEKVSFLRESLKDISEVQIIDDQQGNGEDVDVHIVLLDHYSAELITQICIIMNCDAKLWCFVPRSTLSPKVLALSIDSGSEHRIYPYDSVDDIIRMVMRLADSKSFTSVAEDTMIRSCVRQRLIQLILFKKVFQAVP